MSEEQNVKLAEVLEKLEQVTRRSVQQPLWVRLGQNFLTGMATSLGALILIVLVVPLGMYILRQINWVPLLGEFFDRIVEHMEAFK